MSSTSSSSFRRFKVFSTRKVSLQSGETDAQPKKYWLVESDAKSVLTIRPIDDQTWMPTGRAHPVTVRELQKRYTPEPGIYEQRIQPSMERYSGTLTLMDAPVEEERPPVDETVIISDFQKGMGLLSRGELEKATSVFSTLLNSEGAFEEKHKHLFNDFAIQLRKNNLPSQAIAFYTRALELSWSDEDENLHINLARVLFAEKQYAGCVQHLFDALRIAPGHRVARSFLAWLEQQKVVPKQYALQVKGCLMQKPNPTEGPDAAETQNAQPGECAASMPESASGNTEEDDIMAGSVSMPE